ncbi:leucine-rich repeat-containing protein 49-like isoform X5 [Crassostrea virginica]|uniref:Leucine-rich repeat-containing protein 49-like isoform X7 n=1 Tax=Crassostrea virginica TaxID=6565 RepID=A0A8B8DRL1_CRAVI|nr:leucine-rich repeat-containing protein 49-like isoform X7 [Crassostrea virginica]XP_022330279.1 leucine-rich repeat-containing protein 49-like isoform X7 [Crassostrea virginica]
MMRYKRERSKSSSSVVSLSYDVIWMQQPSRLSGEKIPIHYRANKRPMVPAPACAHDYSTPDIVQDAEESGRNSRSSANLSPKTQKAPAFLPGDRVIFAESPSAPGIPVVYRTPEERSSNPDRLNLDRRKLSVCPILEGEDQLRLLNYQHNMITKIQHLSTLKRLIFLDLYDNQIEEISGLSSLKSLRVLMLGKNRIKKIENLDTLTKLDVLDLHGNQISLIENLNHLAELRVLNLAGNQISNVDNLSGMDSLAELNLRRNRIRTVLDVDNLPSLQRLFLSFNDICSFEDISSLSDSASLSEISLDGNPITQEQYYKQIVLRHMQQLKQLDMKRVTEEERRIALVMARKEEEKKRESNKTNIMKMIQTPERPPIGEKKRLAINNARRQWEVNQSTMINRTGKLIKMPELYANHVGSVANSDIISPSNEENLEVESIQSESKQSSRGGSRPSSAQSGGEETRPRTGNKVQQFKSESQRPGQLKETVIFGNQGQYASDLNNLADLEGDSLTMYGPQSLEALDRNWGVQAAGAVTHVLFKFIDFVDIAKHLHKIRTRFPGVQTITFSSTNIRSLVQINALSAVRRLDNLNIDLDGNPITKFTLWRMFVIFRLAHFALKKINDVEISAADIVNAEKLFGPVSHITTSQLPQSRLLSLIGETRRKQLLAMSEDKSKKILEGKLDKSQGEFVGRSGLTYQSKESVASKSQDSSNKRQFAKTYISEITKETVFTDKKRNEFLKQWPLIFHEMVYSAVTDMSDMQGYMKRCLEELEKS